jgi:hypothetical protein
MYNDRIKLDDKYWRKRDQAFKEKEDALDKKEDALKEKEDALYEKEDALKEKHALIEQEMEKDMNSIWDKHYPEIQKIDNEESEIRQKMRKMSDEQWEISRQWNNVIISTESKQPLAANSGSDIMPPPPAILR